MSTSINQLARRWFEEVWNQRRDETVEELLSPTCAGFMVGHGEVGGAEQFKAIRARFLEAFPDLYLHVEDVVTEGEKAVVRWVARATHGGHGLGVAPTGNSCEFRGLTWMEFQGGKLHRGWDAWDLGGLMQQLQPAQRGQA
jgi:steroid delta-isomerase-like uncharacterized protein